MNTLDEVDWVGCEKNQYNEFQCVVEMNNDLGRGTIDVDRVYFDMSDDMSCTYGTKRDDTEQRQMVCKVEV